MGMKVQVLTRADKSLAGLGSETISNVDVRIIQRQFTIVHRFTKLLAIQRLNLTGYVACAIPDSHLNGL